MQHNSVRHTREEIASMDIRQFANLDKYNQAFRGLLLSIETMHVDDQLAHYERGLSPVLRLAVRQANCTTVESAMSTADLCCDVNRSPIQRTTTERPVSDNMGLAPMQLSWVRGNAPSKAL